MIYRDCFRKGNITLEAIIIVIVLFVFAIVALVAVNQLTELTDAVLPTLTSANATATLQTHSEQTPRMLDGAIIMVLGLFWLGSLAMAYFIDSHPVFMVLSLVLVPAILFVGGTLSNFLIDFFASEGGASALPKTYFVFNNFGSFIVAFIGTYLIAIFAKSRVG